MISGNYRTNRTDFAHLRRPPVHRVTVVQFLVCGLLFLVLQPMGMTVALSALLGGLCNTIPNAYFIWRAFQHRGARSARLIASSFYKGEAGKLLLTVVAFVFVFVLVKPLEPLALFGAFVFVQTVNWFTPLLVKKTAEKN